MRRCWPASIPLRLTVSWLAASWWCRCRSLAAPAGGTSCIAPSPTPIPQRSPWPGASTTRTRSSMSSSASSAAVPSTALAALGNGPRKGSPPRNRHLSNDEAAPAALGEPTARHVADEATAAQARGRDTSCSAWRAELRPLTQERPDRRSPSRSPRSGDGISRPTSRDPTRSATGISQEGWVAKAYFQVARVPVPSGSKRQPPRTYGRTRGLRPSSSPPDEAGRRRRIGRPSATEAAERLGQDAFGRRRSTTEVVLPADERVPAQPYRACRSGDREGEVGWDGHEHVRDDLRHDSRVGAGFTLARWPQQRA